ncbi:MAG: hypothetical protein IPL10_02260 [Bacteroidetes bacterium]|nr:hypothetical protein [Bacteroidota bacterium]
MLLQLDNINKLALIKLFEFAKNNSLELKLVDEDKTKTYLPGKPLTAKETKQLIEKSHKSGALGSKRRA